MVLKGNGLPASVKTVTNVCLTVDVTVLATFTGVAVSAAALGFTMGRAVPTGDMGAAGPGATAPAGEAIDAAGAGALTAAAAGEGADCEAVGIAGGAAGVAGVGVLTATAGAGDDCEAVGIAGAAAAAGAAVGVAGAGVGEVVGVPDCGETTADALRTSS